MAVILRRSLCASFLCAGALKVLHQREVVVVVVSPNAAFAFSGVLCVCPVPLPFFVPAFGGPDCCCFRPWALLVFARSQFPSIVVVRSVPCIYLSRPHSFAIDGAHA